MKKLIKIFLTGLIMVSTASSLSFAAGDDEKYIESLTANSLKFLESKHLLSATDYDICRNFEEFIDSVNGIRMRKISGVIEKIVESNAGTNTLYAALAARLGYLIALDARKIYTSDPDFSGFKKNILEMAIEKAEKLSAQTATEDSKLLEKKFDDYYYHTDTRCITFTERRKLIFAVAGL